MKETNKAKDISSAHVTHRIWSREYCNYIDIPLWDLLEKLMEALKFDIVHYPSTPASWEIKKKEKR